MLRSLAGFLVTVATLAAQQAPDWAALADQVAPKDEAPAFANDIPMNVRAWAQALDEGLSDEDRARLFADGLRRDDVGRAVAVATLLDVATRKAPAPEDLYRELMSCHLLETVARSAAVRGNVTASRTPEWLGKIGATARLRGRTVLAQLLRAFPEDVHTARAIAEGALGLAEKQAISRDEDAAARRAALRRLGDGARAEDHTSLFALELMRRDLDGARAALAAARRARLPFDLSRRESMIERLAFADATLERVAAIEAKIRGGDESPLVQLQLACAIDADDVVDRCRKLVADGFEHALPDTILAMRALSAGRRDEAAAHTERARSLPGGDEGVAVLVAMLQWPELQRRLQEAPDDGATALEVEKLLSEMDELLGEGDSAAVSMLRELRGAGWPQLSQKEVTRYLAEVYGGKQRAPTGSPEFSLAMAGVLAGLAEAEDGLAPALRFLAVPVDPSLAERPLLMRQRAAGATAVAIWADMQDAAPEVQAEARRIARQARAHSRGLGDGAFAGYLDAVEAWVAADSEEDRRDVQAKLAALQVSPIQSGAWLPGSSALVFGRADEQGFDRQAYVNLRAVTGRARDPLSLVPLAVAGVVDKDASSRAMVEYLRSAVQDERGRNVLAVAEVEAGAPPAVAAARARQVLASDAWGEGEARDLARGVWLRFRLDWGLTYNSRGPQLDVRLQCEPVLLPKLPAATKLATFARRR